MRAATRPVTSMISGHLSCKRMRKVGPCSIFHQGQNQGKPNLTLLWCTDSLIFPSCRFLDAYNTPKWLDSSCSKPKKLQLWEAQSETIQEDQNDQKWQEVILSILERRSFMSIDIPSSPPNGDHHTQSPLTWSSNSFSSSAEWTWVLMWSFWQFAHWFNEKRYIGCILHPTSHLHICIPFGTFWHASRATKRGVAATLAFGHLTVVHISHLKTP